MSKSGAWDDMKRAKEEEYFERKNQEALARLKTKDDATRKRKSPITGEEMVQETIMGVVIDRCPTSGGVWLDAGELEQLLEAAQQNPTTGNDGYLNRFIGSLFKKP